MTEKPYAVINHIGIAWAVRFKTEEAAWRRVCRPQMKRGESEEATRLRLAKIGWRVLKQKALQNL